MGVKEPQATFSACFGEAFLPLHPTVYAEMLAKKIHKHETRVWLINTGWSGGKYGVGKVSPLFNFLAHVIDKHTLNHLGYPRRQT
jgi:phosphoenolpyruvate carboxykinase (ATP)